MQKKRFGRLRKAAVILAVVGAAAFLFMRKKCEPEAVQTQKAGQQVVQIDRKQHLSKKGKPQRMPVSNPHISTNERAGSMPSYPLTELLKEEIDYNELNCKLAYSGNKKPGKTRNEENNPLFSAYDTSNSFFNVYTEVKKEFGFVPSDEQISRHMCGSSKEKCPLELLNGVRDLKRNKDMDGLISFVNQIDTLKIDWFEEKDPNALYLVYLDMIMEKRMKGGGQTPDKQCLAWNGYVWRLALESAGAIGHLIVDDPENAGKILSRVSESKRRLVLRASLNKFSYDKNLDYTKIERFFSSLSQDDKRTFIPEMKDNSLFSEKILERLSADSKDPQLRETASYLLAKSKEFNQELEDLESGY